MSLERLDGSTGRPYAPAIIAEGRFVFVSGQTPMRDGRFVDGTIAEQTRATLQNIADILDAAGATLEDVIRCGVFIADLDQLPAFNQAYVQAFGPRLPARTTVAVALPGYDIEIDCIAVLPDR
ncbi:MULTISPECIES: RidA family protein [unclassified Agromyces]|uniref:RidA family protein n=1 Tax=unclassified Agromyces TaxID=2639701 RepID=UPI003014421A